MKSYDSEVDILEYEWKDYVIYRNYILFFTKFTNNYFEKYANFFLKKIGFLNGLIYKSSTHHTLAINIFTKSECLNIILIQFKD